MATTKKKTKKSRSSRRASWRGHLAFGLVSFPVHAFNAFNREKSDIRFHQLHADCHQRIRYQKVCPVHGEVTMDEIVSGYEYRKGKYVEIDPEELDALRTKEERSFTIDAFVPTDAIDPIYFDGRMYYLLPDGAAGEDAYAVILEAMKREVRVGVGQIVLSGKMQIALVRPFEDLLQMVMLNYDEELRTPDEFSMMMKKHTAASRQVRLAQSLIENWSSDNFDFAKYDDEYRKKVKKLIDAKVKGKDVVAPTEAEEEEPEVINLMEALKQSLTKELRNGKPKARPRKRRKRAS